MKSGANIKQYIPPKAAEPLCTVKESTSHLARGTGLIDTLDTVTYAYARLQVCQSVADTGTVSFSGHLYMRKVLYREAAQCCSATDTQCSQRGMMHGDSSQGMMWSHCKRP